MKARMMYGTPPETRLRVVSITGDGRCLFRALVRRCMGTLHVIALCLVVSKTPAVHDEVNLLAWHARTVRREHWPSHISGWSDRCCRDGTLAYSRPGRIS